MPHKGQSREKLIGVALELMLERGYGGVSVDEICKKADMGKGSFYYHFSSKEQLALAALERYYSEGINLLLRKDLLAIEDKEERAFAFIDNAIGISKARWGHGCLLGSLALELTSENPHLKDRAAEMFRQLASNLAEIFEPFSRPTEEDGPTAVELAETMTMLLEGGVVLSQAFSDGEYVPASLRRFRHYLRQLAALPA